MFRKLRRDASGAVLVYVALTLALLGGIVGLSFDLGRNYILQAELEKAARAAAIAGAYQLANQGTAAERARVITAIQTSPVVANSDRVSNAPGAITIDSVSLKNAIPASDDTALAHGDTAGPWDYVMVTTSAKTNNNVFSRLLGRGATVTGRATAVARKGEALCAITPLMICRPTDPNYDPVAWVGRQVLMKAGGSGSSWTEGNWGLLDTVNGSQSTPDLAEAIAGSAGLNACFDSSDGIDTKPGAVTAVNTAFNVRMDIYENPQSSMFKGQAGFHPAPNVRKNIRPEQTSCNNNKYTQTTVDTRYPRDPGLAATPSSARFGNGNWNCPAYWNLVNPGNPIPAACSAGTMTRWELYVHEIQNGILNDLSATGGDNPAPRCWDSNPANYPPLPDYNNPIDRINDRRIFTVAVVDCQANTINGNTSNVPVEHYLSMFLTEPVTDTPDPEVIMEIAGTSAAGGAGPVPVILREWVEIVRG